MEREQAIRFLTEECLFSKPLSCRDAEEIWESHKAVVDGVPREEPVPPPKLPLSAADLKAARKFRSRHPDADFVVDFVRLNPMDLVVHQLWVSTAVADGYRNAVTPDRWLQTALLDPPSHSRFTWKRERDTITFDLPHPEFVLAGPWQPDGRMRVAEPKGFVTVAFHANRALLLGGYHRTFACARNNLEAANAPHGVLFGVSNHLAALGSLANDVTSVMEGPRPPRIADLFDERLYMAVTLRRRRYQMRIQCEVAEIGEDQIAEAQIEEEQTGDRRPEPRRDVPGILADALRLHREGRIADAVALYERAIFLKPDEVAAHGNLGIAFMTQGRVEEAVEHCERTLVLSPGHVDALNNLGIALQAQGRFDEAIAHYRQALAIDPDHAEAHNNLGNMLKEQGELEGAMAHYKRALEIRPDYAEAHYNRAETKTFQRGDAELEALAGKDNLPPDKALYLHFAMAKALEDSGEPLRAFEHLRKGNALKRRGIDYDEARELETIRRISTVFDRSLFDRLQGEGDPSPTPIFVLGMPRSGSTLIEQILAAHRRIHGGAGELPDLDIESRRALSAGGRTARFPEGVAALDGAALRRLGQSYLTRLTALGAGKARIVNKLPGNFVNIGLIRLILPNARIIHTVRDPVDTCVSCYSKLFVSGQYYSYDLAELGRFYRGYRELMTHRRSVLPADAILDVSYEDVVDDLEGQARRLIDYCGLAWDDRCIAFHKNNRPVRTASTVQVRKPLFRTSLQRWRRYEAGIGPLLRELGDIVPSQAAVPAVRERSFSVAVR
jgi:tetratricopeptide (TPR) repeat protein